MFANFLDVIYIPPEEFTEIQTSAPSLDQTVTSAVGAGSLLHNAIAIIGLLCIAVGIACAAGVAVYAAKNRAKAEAEA